MTCVAVYEYEINGYWVAEAAGQTSLNNPRLSRANECCVVFHYRITPIIQQVTVGARQQVSGKRLNPDAINKCDLTS